MSEQEQKKYRINVAVIDESGEEMDAQYKDGIECDKFVILALSNGGACSSAFHNISNIDLAAAIAQNNTMMAAATIAKGILDAQQYETKDKMEELLSVLKGSMD